MTKQSDTSCFSTKIKKRRKKEGKSDLAIDPAHLAIDPAHLAIDPAQRLLTLS